MIRSSLTLAALLITVAGAFGDPVSQDLTINSGGCIRIQPTLGKTNWSGLVEVEHPRFRLVVRGSVSQFSGPSIRKTTPPGTVLRREDLAFEFQWISLVAIGDIKVTVIGPGGAEELITARRFVYVPKDGRILIDGKEWKTVAAPPAGTPSR